MRGIERRTRRISGAALVVTALLLSTLAAPAASAARPTTTTTTSSTTTTLGAAELVATSTGTLYDVAVRIGLVDTSGRTVVRATGQGVTIAMIDTGVVDVPRLRTSRVTIGPDFSFEDMAPNLRGRDTNGHGTHLAGIMVATDSAWGKGDRKRRPDRVLGIAPDAGLISIKAGVADGAVDVTQVIAAINWVVAQKTSNAIDIDVLNLAFGTDSNLLYWDDPLALAVERAWKAGIVVVVAAGNEGAASWQLTSPARDPFVIAVGASELTVESSETTASFTSKGWLRTVDLHAPGRSIVSLRNPGSWSDQFNSAGRVGDDLVKGSGTSQATAVVSAAVALLLEARPSLTPDQVKAVLNQSAVTVTSNQWSWPSRYLNVRTALDVTLGQDATQKWPSATGAGSIDQARGSTRVSIGKSILSGDQDVFGRNWSAAAWTEDSWTGNTWSGSSWTGSTWSSAVWSGNQWSGNQWSGTSWTGSTWSGSTWSGNQWSGSQWSGSTWSGSTWSGSQWSGSQWSGSTWSGSQWSGVTWG